MSDNRRKHIFVLVVSVIASFFIFSSAFCINSEEDTAPISLAIKDIVLTAFSNNKDILIQEDEVKISQALIMGSRSKFLPSVDINAGYTHNDKVFMESPTTGYKNQNQAGISATQAIYTGGANYANFKQAQINFTTQNETLRLRKLNVEFEAKRLYYGLLLAYETERITEELVNQAKAHAEDVSNKLKEGTATKFDLLQSNTQVSLLIPELIKSQNAIEITMAELDKLLGFNVRRQINPLDRLDYSPLDIKEDEFLKIAYLNRPEMILKSLGIDTSKWEIKAAKSGWLPQVNASFGYDYISNDLGDMFNRVHNNWNAGVAVSLNIFDGFSTLAKVREAKSKYAQAVLSKSNIADQTAVDIRRGCLDMHRAYQIIVATKDNVEQAREALRLSIANYDNGEGTNLDVLDAQTSLGQIQKNLYNAIYDYLMAEAYLYKTMGVSIFPELSGQAQGWLMEAKNEKTK